ncbi:MAG: NAD(P)H-quinone oxidoreductase [Devosia sp.]
MTEMPAIEIAGKGGPEVLRLTRRPIPQPGPGEVLIKVAAAGLNGADLAQRRGVYPPPAGASDLPGLEVSGTISALGEGVSGWTIGDRVVALLAGGGYAGYCTAHAGHVLPLPDGLSFVEGATLIEAIATVWTNVFDTAALAPGEHLLVHGGTSGIGVTAIQMARLHGARVSVTVGSAEKAEAARALGAERAINYREEDFAGVIKAEFGKGVDVILDIIGGSYLTGNIKALAPGGRLTIIAFSGGRMGELDLARVMMNRLRITGSTLRSRPDAEKTALIAAVRDRVWPWVADGRFKPVVDSVFPLDKAADAHARMETSQHIGKIVLEVG